ncbi:MAG: hypothetical protein RJB66_1825 [Pseudomonadota bacterium]|jgi:hypothetical protein
MVPRLALFLLFFSFVAKASPVAKVTPPFERPSGHFHLIVLDAPQAKECEKIVAEMIEVSLEEPYLRCSIIPTNSSPSEEQALIDKDISNINKEILRDHLKPLALVFRWQILKNKKFRLSVSNSNRQDETDFEKLSWDLKDSSKITIETARKKLIRKILTFQHQEIALKKALLFQALAKDERWELRDNGRFFHRQNQVEYSIKQTYKLFLQENPRQRNYLRAGLEMLAILGIGKLSYQLNQDANREDWDYDWNNFFSGTRWRFDDNAQSVNMGHSYAGALYYWSARNNGFKTLESYLFALAGSTLWEYVLEHKEVVSINDEVTTTVGGAVIGESLFQISQALKGRSPNSTTTRVFAALLNPVGAFHDLIDGRRPTLEDYGFAPDNQITTNLFTGMGFVAITDKGATTALRFGFEGEVIKLPMNSVGKIKELHLDTVLSQAILSATGTGIVTGELYILLKNVLAAYHQKDITLDEEGRMKGYNFIVGLSQGLEYQSRGYSDIHDWVAAVNVIGTTLDLTAYFKGAQIRLSIDVFGDFAMARNYALEKYREAIGNPIAYQAAVKSIAEKRGYDYGLGPTVRGVLTSNYQQIEIGVAGEINDWSNINGRERFSQDWNLPLSNSETMNKAKVWVAYLPKSFPWLKFVLTGESIYREGQIYDKLRDFNIKNSTTDNRVFGTVHFNFL